MEIRPQITVVFFFHIGKEEAVCRTVSSETGTQMEYSGSLKKNRDFQQVYRRGTSAATRQFVMYVLDNGTENNRLGISVSKKVGNSVVRHHVTRLVREGYRLQEKQFLRGKDIVMIARTPAAQCTQEEVKQNLRYLGKKLQIWEAV